MRIRVSVPIVILFVTAFGVRLYHINEPPMDFHPTRQYHSAIVARAYYFETAKSIPDWRREVASISRQKEGSLREPPIMELLSAFAYWVAGAEYLWIPRLLSSIFWMTGGAFLYLLAKKIASLAQAFFSTAFFLFLPYGITASRSFQPNPLMIMMLMISIFAIFRYYEQPSMVRLVASTALSAMASFVMPMSLFSIFGAFFALGFGKYGFPKGIVNVRSLLFAVVSLLPSVIYYSYNFFAGEFLQTFSHGMFMPQILFRSFFWEGWLKEIGNAVGLVSFAGALLGATIFYEKLSRVLLTGLWVSYFAFAFVFTYHIHTHDYYQLPLIPTVALSLGPIGDMVFKRLRRVFGQSYLRIATLATILIAMTIIIALNVHRIQRKHISPDIESKMKIAGRVFGVNPQFILFVNPDFQSDVRMAQQVGKDVNHSTNTVFLDPKRWKAFQYHGEFSGTNWPGRNDLRAEKLRGLPKVGAEDRFNNIDLKYSPEYFIITDLQEFEAQEDLKDFLAKRFAVVVQDSDYLIFDLKRKADLPE